MTIAIKPESIREPTCACGQGIACDGVSPLKRRLDDRRHAASRQPMAPQCVHAGSLRALRSQTNNLY